MLLPIDQYALYMKIFLSACNKNKICTLRFYPIWFKFNGITSTFLNWSHIYTFVFRGHSIKRSSQSEQAQWLVGMERMFPTSIQHIFKKSLRASLKVQLAHKGKAKRKTLIRNSLTVWGLFIRPAPPPCDLASVSVPTDWVPSIDLCGFTQQSAPNRSNCFTDSLFLLRDFYLDFVKIHSSH